MRQMFRNLLMVVMMLTGGYLKAVTQEYAGITGMMHVPTAEMAFK